MFDLYDVWMTNDSTDGLTSWFDNNITSTKTRDSVFDKLQLPT